MLSEELVIVRDWLRELSGLDLEDVVADSGITAGMVVQHEARGMAARLDRALDAAREEGRQSPRPLPVGVERLFPPHDDKPDAKSGLSFCQRCGTAATRGRAKFCSPTAEDLAALSPPSDGGGA